PSRSQRGRRDKGVRWIATSGRTCHMTQFVPRRGRPDREAPGFVRRLRQLVLERLEVRLPFDASLEPIPLDPFQPDFVDDCELRAEDIRPGDESVPPLSGRPEGTEVECLGPNVAVTPGPPGESPEDPAGGGDGP